MCQPPDKLSEPNPTANQWYVYIVRCQDDTLYTGITTDPERRLREHNSQSALAARYTRARQPVEMVYREAQTDRAAAAKREHQLKSFSRQAKLQLVAATQARPSE